MLPLALFDYAFPKELIAQHPPVERDGSRLMVLDRKTQTWEHRIFRDIVDYLNPGDLLIMNNADADLVAFGEDLVPALPPYIKRKKREDFIEEDFQRYRTVYASVPGSKAAPTAGFHFTEELLQKAKAKGVDVGFVTLHVSYDTFKPIRSDDVLEHPMHGENYVIPEETVQKIERAKKEGHRVIAVGTTSTRVLESWAASTGETTHLFITPGYTFRVVDAMITNFHRPRSTVLVLVSAFAGREWILKAYEEAISEKYHLFSYGDAMFIR